MHAAAGAVDIEVLQEVLQWRIAAARWSMVDHRLAILEAAMASGDAEATMRAMADLELAGPVRITRIGSAELVEPPQPVRERINRLVHQLSAPILRRDRGGDRDQPADRS